MTDGVGGTTGFLLFLLIMGVGLAVIVWTDNQGRARIQRWARQEGLRVIDIESRSFRVGPFLWKTEESDFVFYVTTESPEGVVRHAWARFGGCCSDKLEVRWDE